MLGTDWAVAAVVPNQDGSACRHLDRQGAEVYQPRYREPATRRVLSLYPGYLFVRAATVQLRALKSTYGVLGVLPMGRLPEVISDDVIQQIRRRERGGLVEVTDPYGPGASVRVKRGALSDLLGVSDGPGGMNRISVLLSMMCRTVRVSVEKADLVLA